MNINKMPRIFIQNVKRKIIDSKMEDVARGAHQIECVIQAHFFVNSTLGRDFIRLAYGKHDVRTSHENQTEFFCTFQILLD